MSRVARSALAVVVIFAALPASAFLRETTGGDPTTGTCLWWGGRSVTYEVNPVGLTSTTCPAAVDAELAVSTAVGLWADATYAGTTVPCTDFHFAGGAASTRRAIGNDGHNLIVFRKGPCGTGKTPSVDNCWSHGSPGIIALTTTTEDDVTGQLLDADVELYSWDGLGSPDGTSGWNFGCGGAATGVDITSVVAHESGHMLGLDHVCTDEFGPAFNVCNRDPGTSLAPIMRPQVGSASQRTLAQDDVNGICSIYPKGAATRTCPPVQQRGSSHGGCSSAGGVGLAGLLLALLATARTRRRRV